MDYRKNYFKLTRKILDLTQLVVDNTTPDVVSITFERKGKKHTKKTTHRKKG